MTRAFSAAVINAIQSAGDEERTFLIKFDFSSGPIFLSTGSRDILFSGQTYTATGGGLAIGSVEESSDVKGQGVDVILAGVDLALISTLLSQNFRGRTMDVTQVLLDPTLGTVLDSIPLFAGLQLDNYEIEERVERGQPLTATIRTRGRHRLSKNEFRGIRANLHGHQQYQDGDTFFTHAPSLANKKVYWGRDASIKLGTGGSGTGGDDEGEDGGGDELL